MTTSSPDGMDLAQMKEMATSGNESQRISLVRDPQTPDEVIEILVADRSMLVRDFALTEAKRRGLRSTIATGPESSPAGGGTSIGRSVAGAASQAQRSARLLATVNAVILALSLLGALILIFLGFQKSCVDGSSYCSNYEKEGNGLLVVAGVTGAIVSLWVFAIANAIAARVELAAARAQSRE